MNSSSTLHLEGGKGGRRRWLRFCLQYLLMEGRVRIFHVFCISVAASAAAAQTVLAADGIAVAASAAATAPTAAKAACAAAAEAATEMQQT